MSSSSSISNSIRRRAILAAAATNNNNNSNTMTMHISSPRIVASALDWHCKRRSGGDDGGDGGCILNLRITRHWLDLAICSHPALQQQKEDEEEEDSEMAMVQQLPSIPLVIKKKTRAQVMDTSNKNNVNKQQRQRQPVKVLQHGVAHELASIVQRHNVCGTLVCWPVQPGGWLGSQCGRVLFTLDQIAQQQQQQDEHSSSSSSSHSLGLAVPLCLWDDFHFQQAEDSWGRAAIYAHGTCHEQQQQAHLASVEQYRDRNDTVAAHVWKDFCRIHWPEIYQYQQCKKEHNGKQKKQQQQDTSIPLAGGGGGGFGGDWKVKSPRPIKTTLLAAAHTATAPGNNPWLAKKGEHRLC